VLQRGQESRISLARNPGYGSIAKNRNTANTSRWTFQSTVVRPVPA
jgi:hypothetical protein